MKHLTLPRFWQHYRQLPQEVQELAKKNFELLKADPLHPSLHFKRVGKAKQLWSVRVGVLAKEKPEGMVWFWIGPHAEYDKILS